MAIKVNNNTVIDDSRNINAGVGTFSSLNVPPFPIIFSPLDEATSVSPGTLITITFNQPIKKGTGNITLRNSSNTGTIIETIDVQNTTISGSTVTISPVNSLPNQTNVYVVVDAGAVQSVSFNSNNATISNYNFTTSFAPDGTITYFSGQTIDSTTVNLSGQFIYLSPNISSLSFQTRGGGGAGGAGWNYPGSTGGSAAAFAGTWTVPPSSPRLFKYWVGGGGAGSAGDRGAGRGGGATALQEFNSAGTIATNTIFVAGGGGGGGSGWNGPGAGPGGPAPGSPGSNSTGYGVGGAGGTLSAAGTSPNPAANGSGANGGWGPIPEPAKNSGYGSGGLIGPNLGAGGSGGGGYYGGAGGLPGPSGGGGGGGSSYVNPTVTPTPSPIVSPAPGGTAGPVCPGGSCGTPAGGNGGSGRIYMTFS